MTSKELPALNRGEKNVHFEVWGRQVEMPGFDGGNPEGWVFRAERFFFVHRLTDAEKLDVDAISFEGEALAWYQWEDESRKMKSWGELKSRLQDRFGLSQGGSLCERFLALRQEDLVRGFCQTFETAASMLQGLPKPMLEGVFINRLRPEIRAEVRLVMPRKLEDLMEYAQ